MSISAIIIYDLNFSATQNAAYAGVMGDYPITNNEFGFVEKLMPFTAIDENGVLGLLTFGV